jgi:hypothetical protein
MAAPALSMPVYRDRRIVFHFLDKKKIPPNSATHLGEKQHPLSMEGPQISPCPSIITLFGTPEIIFLSYNSFRALNNLSLSLSLSQ